jgi:hypothetical protein
VIGAEEAYGDLRDVVTALRDQSILRAMTPAGAANCTECGERCRVNHISDESGGKYGFIHCRDCGIAQVPAHFLDRWKIDTGRFLAAAFRGVNLSLQERVPGQLWQVGKANWAGRSRDVWFARAFRRDHAAVAVKELARRPKAILFAPTEAGAGRWQETTKNLVLALETTLSFDNGTIGFDSAYVESRIVDAGLGADSVATRRPKKRAGRTANIESLRKEMIEHLRAARDHAFAKQDQTGEPELLPRPTQKALGKRVGLSESDVSRCLKDEEAGELQLYWNTALDLGQIMAWKGPIAKGRNT